jgi:hypothetical protein
MELQLVEVQEEQQLPLLDCHRYWNNCYPK